MKYKNSVNEWHNSIYSYNLKKLNVILHDKNKSINIILNSYFNLKKFYKNNKNIKLNYNFINYMKKFVCNFTLYKSFINLSSNNLIKLKIWKLKKLSYINWLNKKNNLKISKSLKRIFISFPYIKHTNNDINILIFVFNKYKLLLLNKIKKLNILLRKQKYKKYKKFKKYNKNQKNNITINKIDLINLKNTILKIIMYKKKYIILKKNYLSNLYLNIFKYNIINLINIKHIMYNIYNKKININIVNMKYLYLDNSNLVQAITRKLNDRKKKVLKTLKKTLKLIKLAKFINFVNELKGSKLYYLNNLISINKNLVYSIINNIKDKHLIGIFLEAKGRLTRRMTASRAIYKLRYRGNLKNPCNINKSTLLSRGFIKPNLNINKNNSYNKNGSFGIKSKINTY